MREAAIKQLLHAVGSHGTVGAGGWLQASCPVAYWTHYKGKDSNPSFGVEINVKGTSRVKCFSCGLKGTTEDLVMHMIHLNRKDPHPKGLKLAAAMQLIADEELDDELGELEELDYDELKAGKFQKTQFIEFPELWLDSFMKSPHNKYLTERGISHEVGELLDVRYDFSQARVCFPLRTFAGVLGGLQGRSIIKGVDPRYRLYDYQGHYNTMLWGNEVNVNLDAPVVVTEGFFDLAKIAMVYPNVLCSLTSEISTYKFDRIKDVDRLISFYDFGTGGNKARELLDKYCAKYGILLDHIIPDEETGDAGNETVENIAEAMAYYGLADSA